MESRNDEGFKIVSVKECPIDLSGTGALQFVFTFPKRGCFVSCQSIFEHLKGKKGNLKTRLTLPKFGIIRIWNIGDLKAVTEKPTTAFTGFSEKGVSDMIKWDEDEFLVSSDYGDISVCKIDVDHDIFKKKGLVADSLHKKVSWGVKKLLKLNDERSLLTIGYLKRKRGEYTNRLRIVVFKVDSGHHKEPFQKLLSEKKSMFSPEIVKNSMKLGYFYIGGTDTKTCPIFLLDYMEGEVVLKFESHLSKIDSIGVHKQEDKEYLLCYSKLQNSFFKYNVIDMDNRRKINHSVPIQKKIAFGCYNIFCWDDKGFAFSIDVEDGKPGLYDAWGSDEVMKNLLQEDDEKMSKCQAVLKGTQSTPDDELIGLQIMSENSLCLNSERMSITKILVWNVKKFEIISLSNISRNFFKTNSVFPEIHEALNEILREFLARRALEYFKEKRSMSEIEKLCNEKLEEAIKKVIQSILSRSSLSSSIVTPPSSLEKRHMESKIESFTKEFGSVIERWGSVSNTGESMIDNIPKFFFPFTRNREGLSHVTTSNRIVEEEEEEGEEDDEDKPKLYYYFGRIAMEKHPYPRFVAQGKGMELELHQPTKTRKQFFTRRKREEDTNSSIKQPVLVPVFLGKYKKGFRDGRGCEYDRKHLMRRAFEGEFSGGQKNGRGREYLVTESGGILITFRGRYKKDKKHGRGEKISSGVSTLGKWNSGTLIPTTRRDSVPIPIFNFGDMFQRGMGWKRGDFLGKGAFGEVKRFKTEQLRDSNSERITTLEKHVAVKLFFLSGDSDSERILMQQRCTKSVHICQKIKSNHVLKVHGLVIGGYEAGYVMECGKMSIFKMICNGFIEDDLKLRILTETAQGMCDLHREGIVHRDLNWNNVLIMNDSNETIKICDFDTFHEDESLWRLSRRSSYTTAGGTGGYIAPEVVRGEEHKLASDVYSFGVMIFGILFEVQNPYSEVQECPKCGRGFKHINLTAFANFTSQCVLSCGLRPSCANNPGNSVMFAELLDLMDECWNQSPNDRPSFEEILTTLKLIKIQEETFRYVEFKLKILGESREEYKSIGTKLFENPRYALLERDARRTLPKILARDDIEKINFFKFNGELIEKKSDMKEYLRENGSRENSEVCTLLLEVEFASDLDRRLNQLRTEVPSNKKMSDAEKIKKLVALTNLYETKIQVLTQGNKNSVFFFYSILCIHYMKSTDQ